MTLKDKYGIPQSTWQALCRDGIISSKMSRAEDIIACFNRKLSSGLSRPESVKATADEMECTDTWVREVVKRWQ